MLSLWLQPCEQVVGFSVDLTLHERSGCYIGQERGYVLGVDLE